MANGDTSFDESTEKLIDTTAVDNRWSSGYVGLHRGAAGTTAQFFDDVQIGYDNSSPKDSDIADPNDVIAADAWTCWVETISLRLLFLGRLVAQTVKREKLRRPVGAEIAIEDRAFDRG